MVVGRAERFREDGRLTVAFLIAERGRLVGELLNARVPEPGVSSVGVVTAGGTAYTYIGGVVDILGLNWLAMGHSPGDREGPRDHAAFNADVFWSAPPDLVLPYMHDRAIRLRCADGAAVFLGDLVNTGAFRSTYVPVTWSIGDEAEEFGYGDELLAYVDHRMVGELRGGPVVVDWEACSEAPGN